MIHKPSKPSFRSLQTEEPQFPEPSPREPPKSNLSESPAPHNLQISDSRAFRDQIPEPLELRFQNFQSSDSRTSRAQNPEPPELRFQQLQNIQQNLQRFQQLQNIQQNPQRFQQLQQLPVVWGTESISSSHYPSLARGACMCACCRGGRWQRAFFCFPSRFVSLLSCFPGGLN